MAIATNLFPLTDKEEATASLKWQVEYHNCVLSRRRPWRRVTTSGC